MFDFKCFLILCLVVVLKDCISALGQEECFKEDFGDESLGILNRPCTGPLPQLDVRRYADFTGVLEKPPGSNPFFIVATANLGSCVENTKGLIAEGGTDILFRVFSKTPQPHSIAVIWLVTDIESEATVHRHLLTFSNNDNGWKNVNFSTPRNANIRINLRVGVLQIGAIFAVDYMRIKKPDAEDCIDFDITTQSTPDTSTDDPGTTLQSTSGSNTEDSVTMPPSTPGTATEEAVTTPPPTPGTSTDDLGTPQSTPSIEVTTNFETTSTSTKDPIIVQPSDYELWKTLSIVAVSLAAFSVLYSTVLTVITCWLKPTSTNKK